MKQEISFVYEKNGKTYTVFPYRIIFSEGFWYLAAGKDGSIRKFSLDLMSGVKTTGKVYDKLPEGLDREIDGAKSIFFDPHNKRDVVCLMSKDMADYIRRKQFFPHQKTLEELADGSVRFGFVCGSALECFKLCVTWIPHIRIESPADFRDYFRDTLTQAVAE